MTSTTATPLVLTPDEKGFKDFSDALSSQKHELIQPCLEQIFKWEKEKLYTAAKGSAPASGFLSFKDQDGNNALQLAIQAGHSESYQCLANRLDLLGNWNDAFSIVSSTNKNNLNVFSMFCDPKNKFLAKMRDITETTDIIGDYKSGNNDVLCISANWFDQFNADQIVQLLSAENKYPQEQQALVMPEGTLNPPTANIGGLQPLEMLSFYSMGINTSSALSTIMYQLEGKLSVESYARFVPQLRYAVPALTEWINSNKKYQSTLDTIGQNLGRIALANVTNMQNMLYKLLNVSQTARAETVVIKAEKTKFVVIFFVAISFILSLISLVWLMRSH